MLLGDTLTLIPPALCCHLQMGLKASVDGGEVSASGSAKAVFFQQLILLLLTGILRLINNNLQEAVSEGSAVVHNEFATDIVSHTVSTEGTALVSRIHDKAITFSQCIYMGG